MKRLVVFLMMLLSLATGAAAQIINQTPSAPLGNVGSVLPYGYQRDVGISSPFSWPYLVTPNTSASGGQQTQASRLANATSLNVWFQAANVTRPGALGTLNDQSIEVCVIPGGSIDFRNTSALAGAYIIGVAGGAKLIAYNCNDPNGGGGSTYKVQGPIVQIGGRQQTIKWLTVADGVNPTVDPIVNTLTGYITAGVFTVSTTSVASGAGTGGGALAAGQTLMTSPDTTLSPTAAPVNCYVVSKLSGTGSAGSTYQLGGGCTGATNIASSGSPQTFYGGQAGEIANDGINGNQGFSIWCPTQGNYGLYATNVATAFGVAQAAAGTYGSCGTWNTMFSNHWDFIRGDLVTYRFWDQGVGSGSSGDDFDNVYFTNGSFASPGDINNGVVMSLMSVAAKQWNIESSVFGTVASADFINPARTAGTAQPALNPGFAWFDAGTSRYDIDGLHIESNQWKCNAGVDNGNHARGGDNTGIFQQNSSSSISIHGMDFANNTALVSGAGCNHLALVRKFGSSNSFYLQNLVDYGNSGSYTGSANNITSAFVFGTSNNSTIAKGQLVVTGTNLKNGTVGITPGVYQLPAATSNAPVWKGWDGVETLTGAAPATVTGSMLKALINVTGLTTAAGLTSGALTVTATDFVNTATYGVRCSVLNYTGTGLPIVTNVTTTGAPGSTGVGTYSFTITNIAAAAALSATVPVYCVIDNGAES